MANSFLMIIFTKCAWFSNFSNCSCSLFARKSCKSKKNNIVRSAVVYPTLKMQMAHACLALLVVRQSLRIEFIDDFFWRVVLLDLALKVEADHVVHVNLACQFEELGQALLFCLFNILYCQVDDEVHIDVVVVFLIILLGV